VCSSNSWQGNTASGLFGLRRWLRYKLKDFASIGPMLESKVFYLLDRDDWNLQRDAFLAAQRNDFEWHQLPLVDPVRLRPNDATKNPKGRVAPSQQVVPLRCREVGFATKLLCYRIHTNTSAREDWRSLTLAHCRCAQRQSKSISPNGSHFLVWASSCHHAGGIRAERGG